MHRIGISFITILCALAINAQQRIVIPQEKPDIPYGLQGRHIAMWQSHGWYFEPSLNRWEWQRARIFQTVEDLYTQSYVLPFLMPMLENAGAYVMSPRERDYHTLEIIVDNDNAFGGYAEHNGANRWGKTQKPGFGHDGQLLTVGVNPFRNGTARSVDAVQGESMLSTATWSASIPEDGEYAVYISYQTLPNSIDDARYTVHAANGDKHFTVNQQMGGGTWIYLGHFPLAKGNARPIVSVDNSTHAKKGVLTADAVKIGGGMGNVARIVKESKDDGQYGYVASKYPRFTEGSRYWLQWAGAPDSVYTPTDNENDYNDDYRSRGLWVNWMSGGSAKNPKMDGLNVPIDLSMAFHSDAGTTWGDTIIGTLGIYCTRKHAKLPTGESRDIAKTYTDMVMTNIVRDVQAAYEPNWVRREMRDKEYAEARSPEVPALLLELLSHQNFADMKYGLDPSFRFTVSRAIYKGILQFLADRYGCKYVVQPLPVRNFAISNPDGSLYTLSWKETEDKLEPTAHPTYYIIEERVGDELGFRQVDVVDTPSWQVSISDNKIHSYRIIAGNDGGVSFPSEVLALRHHHGGKQALVVNGFTRVSGPDYWDSGELAGFYDERDHGMPYVYDISYIGSQMEFRRDIPWMDDDAPGFGASRSNYETAVIAGNTYDYVALHGQAIADAGYGFVSMSVAAFCEASVQDVLKYKVLDLILGKQKEIKVGTGAYGNKYKAFPSELQQRLAAYAQGGGSMLVSGSYIATDIWDNPYSSAETAAADQKFATEVLGYHWRAGQASLTGQAYVVPSRFHEFKDGEYDFYNQLNQEFYAVDSPDSFYAVDKRGATIMRYSENNLVAGTAYDAGAYRTVALGFPFETIKGAHSRNALMKEILKFLDK